MCIYHIIPSFPPACKVHLQTEISNQRPISCTAIQNHTHPSLQTAIRKRCPTWPKIGFMCGDQCCVKLSPRVLGVLLIFCWRGCWGRGRARFILDVCRKFISPIIHPSPCRSSVVPRERKKPTCDIVASWKGLSIMSTMKFCREWWVFLAYLFCRSQGMFIHWIFLGSALLISGHVIPCFRNLVWWLLLVSNGHLLQICIPWGSVYFLCTRSFVWGLLLLDIWFPPVSVAIMVYVGMKV